MKISILFCSNWSKIHKSTFYFTGNMFVILIPIGMLFGCSNIDKSQINSAVELKINIDTFKLIQLPNIGEVVNESIRKTSTNNQILINSSQSSSFANVYYNNLVFQIAWNRDNKLVYISTSDTNFNTEENIRINMTYNDIQKTQNTSISKIPGWGYYVKLNSGWNAAFCVDNTCTGRDISRNDTVKWIFKN
jgi:hypothetical protein